MVTKPHPHLYISYALTQWWTLNTIYPMHAYVWRADSVRRKGTNNWQMLYVLCVWMRVHNTKTQFFGFSLSWKRQASDVSLFVTYNAIYPTLATFYTSCEIMRSELFFATVAAASLFRILTWAKMKVCLLSCLLVTIFTLSLTRSLARLLSQALTIELLKLCAWAHLFLFLFRYIFKRWQWSEVKV